ncbi:hypothetical protein AAKU55_003352 [Oxalobacteraceae bacterium GrIS 1.11]
MSAQEHAKLKAPASHDCGGACACSGACAPPPALAPTTICRAASAVAFTPAPLASGPVPAGLERPPRRVRA